MFARQEKAEREQACLELGDLGEGIVAEVDCLGAGLGLVGAPGLAPQPLLRQRVDRNVRLQVVRQVLVLGVRNGEEERIAQ